MVTCRTQELESVRNLVALAQSEDEPVMVFDGEDECLVAMRPAVFERILFDIDRIKLEMQQPMRL